MDLSEVANTRKIFFTNLLLLGFNPEINEAQTRIHFHQDMFKVPNRAAFEIVIKYLLDKLDPIRSNQEFRDCWPIGDKKREMEFRKVCVAWLTQIASEPHSNLPTIAQSLFLSPGGQRCDQLLANFSRYVLKQVMKKELGDKGGTLSPNLNDTQFNLKEVQAKTLMSAMIVERQKYFETLQRSIIETEQQAQFARWLESRFVKIPPEQKLSDQKSRHSEVLLNKVRKQWNELNKVITDIKQERSVIQSVLQGGMERYQISAADLSLRVPNRLLEKFQNEMHLRGKANTYTEGKVNIISVLRLFNMALSSVINKIREENLEINAEKIHRLSEEVSRHHNQLAQFIALQSNISDVIVPSIKQSNTSLKMKLDQSYL